VPVPRDKRASHERAVQAMRAALGDDGFAAAWAAGQVLAVDEALALAVEAHADRGRWCASSDTMR
jgi:hypothetical protein